MASRFNFNAITLTDAADITKIAENFNKYFSNYSHTWNSKSNN